MESEIALAMFFNPSGMTSATYAASIAQLEAAGQGNPSGRAYHAAFKADDGIHIFDVWDSQEQFEAFGEVLMPILGGLGIDPGMPMVSEVENVIIPS